ncbi:MAG: polysaccharide biosynthesis C-terminal domain-containing protein [Pseudomonadota bacterium]
MQLLLQRFPTSLFGTSFLLTFARLAGAGVGILLQIVIARHYGAQSLGIYYQALSLAAIFSVFISVGYPWIVAPIVAAKEADNSPELLSNFLTQAFKDTFAISILLGIPLALAIWYSGYFGADERVALLVGLLTAPVYVVMRMMGGIANALKHFQLANLPELLLRPTLILAIVSFAVIFQLHLGAVSIVTINLIVSVALATYMVSALGGAIDLSFGRSSAQDQPAAEKSRLRKLAVPMIFSTLFINMFADLDILIVSMILPTSETGIFGVCMKIAALLVFAVQVTHQILLRDASDAHRTSDKMKMQSIIGKANRIAIASSILSFLVILFFGKLLLGIFGQEFLTGYYCLLGLSLAQFIRAAFGPAIQILMITGHQRAGIPVYIGSLIVLVVCNLILVPAYGYEGAAIAVIITTLFWSVWLNRLVKQKSGYGISIFSTENLPIGSKLAKR